MPAKTIGLIAHTGKPGVADLVNAVAEEFSRFKLPILVEKETAKIAGRRSGLPIIVSMWFPIDFLFGRRKRVQPCLRSIARPARALTPVARN